MKSRMKAVRLARAEEARRSAGGDINEECKEKRAFRGQYATGGDFDIHAKLDVDMGQIGCFDKWLPHEGHYSSSHSIASTEPLRKKLFEITGPNELLEDMVQFVNCVLIHSCSSYCLRSSKRKRASMDSDGSISRDPVYECRFHYGFENQGVVARTDGKAAHHVAMLETHSGVTTFAPSRDHPRIVAGPAKISRIYAGINILTFNKQTTRTKCCICIGNFDMQAIISPTDDIPDAMKDGNGTVIENIVAYLEDNPLGDDDGSIIKEIRDNRSMLNRDEYACRVCDYVVAYACKGEISATGAVGLFKEILHSPNLSDNTSFQSLALRLNMKVLKSRCVLKAFF